MSETGDVESTLVVVPSGTNIKIDGMEFGLLDDCFMYGNIENVAIIRKKLLVLKEETK